MADTWYEDDTLDEEIDYPVKEYDVTASPNDFNIKTLFDFICSGVLSLPGFQRNYVWDIKRASKLIESIIIGIPIPQIFLFEEARNRFLVLDGQQRLMSIYYFMVGRFPRKDKRSELRLIFDRNGSIPENVLENNAYFTEFSLRLSETLPEHPNKLNKLKYATLGDYRSSFDLRTIRNIIIKQNLPPDDDSIIFEIFNRLNTGGMNLSPQEIRCSLYHSKFYSVLREVNMDARWRDFLGSNEPDLRMKDIEFLLRGFALLVNGEKYSGSTVKFLNTFSRQTQTHSAETNTYFKSLFLSFLDACANLPSRAFFGNTGKFTISIYDAVFAVICERPFKDKAVVENTIDPVAIEKLKADSEFMEASQAGTSKKVHVSNRLKRARAILGGEL